MHYQRVLEKDVEVDLTNRSVNEQVTTVTLLKRAEIGAVGGLVGGFSIFFFTFIIDSNLGVVPGTFYKMVGIPIGLGEQAATIFGMVAHMLTAGLIGTVFCFASGLHKKLEVKSTKKGVIAGGVTGIAVYAIFFVPITLLIMGPALESNMADEQGIISTVINVDSTKLMENLNLIIIGSLEIHIVYGIIMGVFCGVVIKHQIEDQQRIKQGVMHKLKIITILIILGTAALGGYYAMIPTYSTPAVVETPLSAELNKFEEGLTYAKFTSLDEKERTLLVQRMHVPTINLLLEDAKKQNSWTSDGMDQITSHMKSNDDLKFVQIVDFQGVKGNIATGLAMIVTSGDATFLRFEEFDMDDGYDLYVYLTKSGDVSTGFEIAKLKANHGNQNYEITGIDTSAYRVVVIYSKSFAIYYASANLPPIENL